MNNRHRNTFSTPLWRLEFSFLCCLRLFIAVDRRLELNFTFERHEAVLLAGFVALLTNFYQALETFYWESILDDILKMLQIRMGSLFPIEA